MLFYHRPADLKDETQTLIGCEELDQNCLRRAKGGVGLGGEAQNRLNRLDIGGYGTEATRLDESK